MEPTTLNAILIMERSGLVKRICNKVDKRKIHIHLTPKERKLKDELLPLAVSVVNTATKTFFSREITTLLKMLSSIRTNSVSKARMSTNKLLTTYGVNLGNNPNRAGVGPKDWLLFY